MYKTGIKHSQHIINSYLDDYMVKDQIDLKEECKQLLISNNIPITRPRILLLEILLKNKGPLKVEDIIKLSKGKLALSSLYRIINSLKFLPTI